MAFFETQGELSNTNISSEWLYKILEAVPNGLILVDSSGTIILCNAEMEKMFGYDEGELLQKPLEMLVPQRYRSMHVHHRQDFSAHPSRRQMGAGRDLTGVCKDGSEIPVEIGLNPISSSDGFYTVASIVDITERKKIDHQLHMALETVQRKNSEMEQFVYTVSHDLKSPLVTSSSYLGFLHEDLKDKRYESLQDSLEKIEKAHKKMQELIEDLLQLSRTSIMGLNISEVNVGNILLDIKDDLSVVMDEKKIDLIVPDETLILEGDPKKLMQVFENLISNAIKYASGVERAKIQVSYHDVQDEHRICVKDNGPGIAPEYHKKIFALFQRLQTDKDGTGVGLTIVSQIVNMHGGRAWVESEVGKGAEFWIAIPKTIAKERGKETCLEH
jgi:PAS domain S-box